MVFFRMTHPSTFLFLWLMMLAVAPIQSSSDEFHGWINEFHYRNVKDDVNLFIEIAGPKGKEAWEYLIVLYQGRNGTQFRKGISLSGMTFSEEDKERDIGFIKYDLDRRQGSIRNGKHGGDGLALVFNGQCVQFLCYSDENSDPEEVFTAWSGPCNGKNCQNIGVYEARDNPVGKSIQMVGSGRYMDNFTWNPEVMDWTPGQVNNGQSMLTPTEYYEEKSNM